MISLQHDNQYQEIGLIDAFHLVYYVAPKHGKDETEWSNRVGAFKAGHNDTITRWTNWAKQEIKAKRLNIDYIIRVLGSKEIYVQNTKPLDLLGIGIANELNIQYTPQLLCKTRVTTPLHFLSREDRFNEINNVYYVDSNSKVNLNNRTLLIIDDITTTSITIQEIIRALNATYHNLSIYLFCIARTKNFPFANYNIESAYFD